MKRRKEPTVPVCIRLPEQLYNEARVLNCDPSSGRLRYGTWGALYERLLREWVDAQKVTTRDVRSATT